MKKKTGVWIDFDKAYVIELSEQHDKIKKIESGIEHFNVLGGSRSSTKYGPQDNVSESKMLARNLQQQKKFFETIMKQIDSEGDLVLFGPAEAKMNFKKMILEDHVFKNKKIPVEPSDSMSENQMKAWVSAYLK